MRNSFIILLVVLASFLFIVSCTDSLNPYSVNITSSLTQDGKDILNEEIKPQYEDRLIKSIEELESKLEEFKKEQNLHKKNKIRQVFCAHCARYLDCIVQASAANSLELYNKCARGPEDEHDYPACALFLLYESTGGDKSVSGPFEKPYMDCDSICHHKKLTCKTNCLKQKGGSCLSEQKNDCSPALNNECHLACVHHSLCSVDCAINYIKSSVKLFCH